MLVKDFKKIINKLDDNDTVDIEFNSLDGAILYGNIVDIDTDSCTIIVNEERINLFDIMQELNK